MLGWLEKQRKRFNKATGGGIDFIGDIGPLAQVGSALIGASAAGKAAKASQRGTDLKKLRKEAEAAGFNPLTVLRASGGQGFNKGSSGALASASFWSSFANSAGQIAAQFDPHKRKMQRLDLDIAKETLWNMKGDDDRAEIRLSMDQNRLAMDKFMTYGKIAKDDKGNIIFGYGGIPKTMDESEYKVTSLTSSYRDPVSGRVYSSLNPDAFEIGISEAAAGAAMHAGSDAVGLVAPLLERRPSFAW